MTASKNGEILDTVFELRKLLTAISDVDLQETFIANELKEIQKQFASDTDIGDEGFYGTMILESVIRSKKILQYKHRAQGILDRLSAFLSVSDKPKELTQ